MGWKGMAIGGCLGSLFGGTVGAIFGALLGAKIEKEITSQSSVNQASPNCNPSDFQTIFLASAAAMLAKMAKADGHVTLDEIRSVERAFTRLGFSPLARSFAVKVFRRAKDDTHSIYEYAAEFALAVRSLGVRELLYELLWDVACADGVVSPEELEYLRNLPRSLSIRATWFNVFYSDRLHSHSNSHSNSYSNSSSHSNSYSHSHSNSHSLSLDDAYSLLGVSPTATMDEVRKAYRAKAKQYHPDVLRAQGMPDEMIAKATDMMSKINNAFSEIEKAKV